VTIFIVSADLMATSRIAEAATAQGLTWQRVDSPGQLPDDVGPVIALVNWGERETHWADAIERWRQAGRDASRTVVLFGPHTDREGHAEARRHGIGPVHPRSRFLVSPAEWLRL
jgi:hypothetical protein